MLKGRLGASTGDAKGYLANDKAYLTLSWDESALAYKLQPSCDLQQESVDSQWMEGCKIRGNQTLKLFPLYRQIALLNFRHYNAFPS